MSIASTTEKPEQRVDQPASELDRRKPEKVRRTRGANPANRRTTPKPKSNGHDSGAGRANGHGQATPSGTALDMGAPQEKGKAASDDARDIPAAAAATSAVAGKERDACAEVAPPLEGELLSPLATGEQQAGSEAPRVPSENSDMRNHKKDQEKDQEKGTNSEEPQTVDIPPGSEPLPEDGPGFVDAMHEHVDLYQACARLVKSKDEKIAQRMMERLLEMSYGKSPSANGDEIPQIIFDAPRPIHD